MEKIKILSDSTCDLTPEQIVDLGVEIVPVEIILGTDTYLDGTIGPQDLFDYYERTGQLPKTAATNAERYKEHFEKYLNEGYKIIHFNISSKSIVSPSHNSSGVPSLLISKIAYL